MQSRALAGGKMTKEALRTEEDQRPGLGEKGKVCIQLPLSTVECLKACETGLNEVVVRIGAALREEFMKVEVEKLAGPRGRHLRDRKCPFGVRKRVMR